MSTDHALGDRPSLVQLGLGSGLWGSSVHDRLAVVAYAILGHLVAFGPAILVGVWYLLKGGPSSIRVTGHSHDD